MKSNDNSGQTYNESQVKAAPQKLTNVNVQQASQHEEHQGLTKHPLLPSQNTSIGKGKI